MCTYKEEVKEVFAAILKKISTQGAYKFDYGILSKKKKKKEEKINKIK